MCRFGGAHRGQQRRTLGLAVALPGPAVEFLGVAAWSGEVAHPGRGCAWGQTPAVHRVGKETSLGLREMCPMDINPHMNLKH